MKQLLLLLLLCWTLMRTSQLITAEQWSAWLLLCVISYLGVKYYESKQ